MSAPRKSIFTVFLLFTVVAGSAGSVWRARAQNAPAPSQSTVQALPDRIPPPRVTEGDRGVTYHSLENKATHVTTTFRDAIAIAERGPDGDLSTRVTDLAGNEVARFKVHRVDAGSDSLEFTVADRATKHAARRSGLRPTLDWSNQQAYSFWKDRDALDSSSLEWQGTLMRPAGARRRDVMAEALRTDTEWLGGASASVIKKVGTHTSYVTKRTVTGPVFISSFNKGGVEVGFSQWWPEEQAFAWSFPGLTEGYIDAARLQPSGGWSFTPDMAWLNTQNLALHEFHTAVATQGRVSQKQSGWLHKIGTFVVPALLANEVGCDYLHWLDQSIFRPCCDSHDRCYEKDSPACTANSWWMFWSSWQCTRCNMWAVFCFKTGGGGHVLYRLP
jgi:hypothetical protein